MAHHITLNAESLGEVTPQVLPNYGVRSVELQLRLTDEQREDSIQALISTLTGEQWDELRRKLDKEFAT